MSQAATDSRTLDAASSATEGKPRFLRGGSGLLARIALSAIVGYLQTYSRPLVGFMERNPRYAPTVALSNRGRLEVEAIRARFRQFLDTETALSNARQSRARTTARHALEVGGAGLAASMLL